MNAIYSNICMYKLTIYTKKYIVSLLYIINNNVRTLV